MSFEEPERLELLEALSECAQNKADLKALITELAEWCSQDPESITEYGKALLQRAREATK